jgi:hypothetical protein
VVPAGESVPETEIRARIRALVSNAAIPCDAPERLWAGDGSGSRCAGCRETIAREDVEYEAELNGRTLRFHRRCHQIWLEECAPSGA